MAGAFKRVVAGMPSFMTETQSPREIAFPRDDPGHMVSLDLPTGHSICVREHQSLAATGASSHGGDRGIDDTFTCVRGIGNMPFGGTGLIIDRFQAGGEEDLAWLHSHGSVAEKVLAAGESVEVEVEGGAWVHRDGTVSMQPAIYGPTTGVFCGSGQLVFNRFTGPGGVGIQSAYVHLPTED